ncbi:hypothetical protein AB0H23_31885 [Streptomyces albogriseolus]|uniref:hypothetical protein n=1 Tax=Streptomyces albogriseolus TaxID=1887 RepID=UPI00346025C5
MASERAVSLSPDPEVQGVYRAITHEVDGQVAYRWQLGEAEPVTTDADRFSVPAGTPAGTNLSVTVLSEAEKELCHDVKQTEEAVTAGAAGQDGSGATAGTTGTIWSTPLVWWAGGFLSVLYVVILVLLWAALHDDFTAAQGGPPFAPKIAAALVAVGILGLLAGVFLGLLEFRGKATATVKKREASGADLFAVEVDLGKVLEQFRQMPNQLAALFIALVCFIGATVITALAPEAPAPGSAQSSLSTSPTPGR